MSGLETNTNGATPGNRVDVLFTPTELSEERLKHYTAVVVDVLRSGTSIVTALQNGARYVIPVPSVSEATALAAQLDRDGVMLCGERDGKIIEGFHIGNSPAEYTRERVRARHLIFGSTNGSPAIVRAAGAKKLYMCGFVNLDAMADALVSRNDMFPLAIVCAGKVSRFSIEDAVCAGMLIGLLQERLKTQLTLNDAARVSVMLAERYSTDIEWMLRDSDHGRYLAEIGMDGDLPLCAAVSSISVVPTMKEGKLVKLEEAEGLKG